MTSVAYAIEDVTYTAKTAEHLLRTHKEQILCVVCSTYKEHILCASGAYKEQILCSRFRTCFLMTFLMSSVCVCFWTFCRTCGKALKIWNTFRTHLNTLHLKNTFQHSIEHILKISMGEHVLNLLHMKTVWTLWDLPWTFSERIPFRICACYALIAVYMHE